jgi:hypothetical protein
MGSIACSGGWKRLEEYGNLRRGVKMKTYNFTFRFLIYY